MSFSVKLFVSPRAALKTGNAAFGSKDVVVVDSDLERLPLYAREELATVIENNETVGKDFTINGVLHAGGEATAHTVDDLFKLLEHRAQAREWAIKAQAERDERKRGEEERARENEAVNKREDDVRKDKERRAIQKWVTKQGTPSQRKRLAEGVLPETEALEAIADAVFDELTINQIAEKYNKISADDVCECACADDAVYTVTAANSLTEAQYDTVVTVREEAEAFKGGSRVWAVSHHGKCATCDCPPVKRLSLRVELVWEGLDIVREYNI